MVRPMLRVDLSDAASDFQLLALEPGVPMLDQWNSTGATLRAWLGRFAAEAVWEGESACFYVRNDEEGSPERAQFYPATEADLQGKLRGEFAEIIRRLQQAQPASVSAEALHRLACDHLMGARPGSGSARRGCALFKYRNSQGRWRLVWCYGYQPVPGREGGRPVICGNPECRQLALVQGLPGEKCRRCGKPFARRLVPARYVRRAAVLLLFLLLGGLAIYAFMRPSAVLTGRVVCAADQRPIADAEVAIEGTSLKALSDEQGAFRIERAGRGVAIVVVSAPGFRRESLPVRLAAWTSNVVEVKLRGAARISGQVVYMLGKEAVPIANARVAEEGSSRSAAQTDQRGLFALGGLSPGQVAIHVFADGFRAAKVPATASLDGQPPLRVVLVGDRTVAGKVVYAADPSLPVADAEVVMEAAEQPRTRTGSDGRFSFSGVPPAEVRVEASAKGFFRKRVLAAPGERSLCIPLAGDANLVGHVIRADTQKPVPNAEVRLSGSPFKARTDEKGAFRLAGARSGPARITAAAPGLAGALSKDLAPDQDNSVRILVTGSATISGRVTSAMDQRPVAEATVAVAQSDLKATTDEQGKFVLAGVVPPHVTLGIAAKGYFPKELQQPIADGERQLGDLTLVPAAMVSGLVVRAPDRKPIPNVTIELRAEGVQRTLTSDQEGKFTVGELPPGPLQLVARAAGYDEARLEKSVTPDNGQIEVLMSRTRGVSIRGSVVNAVNNKPIPNAKVMIRAGDVQRGGAADDEGRFEIEDLPSGAAEVQASAPGFETAKLAHSGGTDPLRVALSPIVPPGEIRIVLTWGAEPRDLDAHLYGPLPNGGRFHISYQDFTTERAALDVDNTQGFGPETVTLKTIPGTYNYLVADYAMVGTPDDGKRFARSGAQVVIFHQGGQARQPFVVPANASGPVWHVFDLVVSPDGKPTIVPKNRWSRNLPDD